MTSNILYRSKFIWLAVLLLLFQNVWSQNDTVKTNLLEWGVGLAEEVLDAVTWEKGRHVVSVYPAAGYSPRTGIEIGVMPVWRIGSLNKEMNRPTTLASSFQVSTKGMYEVKLDLISYWRNNWSLSSKLQYLFLHDEFFGIGNGIKAEPFTQYDLNSFVFTSDIAKGLNDQFFIGLRLDFNSNRHDNIEGGLLNELISGYKGGWANGIGPVFIFDNRNDVLYPEKGWLITGSTLFYNNYLGSDFDFNLSLIDIRRYFPILKENNILAAQLVLNSSSGNVPFYKLPSVGGKYNLRGIPHPYKYIDKASWFTQFEWRQKVWWRIGAVGFGGLGKVMPDFSSSWFSDLHAVAGFGLRFQALPKDGLNFRMDYGFSNHNESGVFFTIREAF
ncbi:BamA/TamA family outer membrane protein [Carboxylicivirga caseinilyticus]|uniref:BamA/TamA family outer membrane protein n=1 Tax=Carboxylicivirga caseinilyticus TaxID=3417572 RepID=UPI003D355135|nr:BamA/TamA family outer membrane protein [Marinilabiliaceae bacterium A049]